MIPVRIINYPFPDNNLKDLTFKTLQQQYASLEDEIIQNEAIVVIDFGNDIDYNYNYFLENAPENLVKKFDEMGEGDYTFSLADL